MEGEASRLCGAEYGERSDERSNVRNGYRERVLETRMGTVGLKIPKLREGSYLPSFLDPRRRWEQAFVSVVSEAYVLGGSTLDEDVKAFRERKLDRAYPYLWLDAVYLKVRDGKQS